MTAPTPTPRTDAARQNFADYKSGNRRFLNPDRSWNEQPDGWGFARQLERELSTPQGAAPAMREALRDAVLEYLWALDKKKEYQRGLGEKEWANPAVLEAHDKEIAGQLVSLRAAISAPQEAGAGQLGPGSPSSVSWSVLNVEGALKHVDALREYHAQNPKADLPRVTVAARHLAVEVRFFHDILKDAPMDIRMAFEYLKAWGASPEADSTNGMAGCARAFASEYLRSPAAPLVAPTPPLADRPRAAFDEWFRKRHSLHPVHDTTFVDAASEPWYAFKAGAAWADSLRSGSTAPGPNADLARYHMELPLRRALGIPEGGTMTELTYKAEAEINRLRSGSTATPPPEDWKRDGFTFYTLMHHGWKKGVEEFRNRISFYINFDASVPMEEREGVAASILGNIARCGSTATGAGEAQAWKHPVTGQLYDAPRAGTKPLYFEPPIRKAAQDLVDNIRERGHIGSSGWIEWENLERALRLPPSPSGATE